MISETDAEEMLELARDLREMVHAFLREQHPDLLR